MKSKVDVEFELQQYIEQDIEQQVTKAFSKNRESWTDEELRCEVNNRADDLSIYEIIGYYHEWRRQPMNYGEK